MKNVEKEFKWDASGRCAFTRFLRCLHEAGAAVTFAGEQRINDRYLDDETGSFCARKIALRVRRANGVYEATLKSAGRVEKGLAARRELTRPLPQARTLAQAVAALEASGTWDGAALKNLHEIFRVNNRRRVYRVEYGNVLCEAALDTYVVHAGGKSQRKKEIELELKSGSTQDFSSLGALLRKAGAFVPAEKSKVATARALLVL